MNIIHGDRQTGKTSFLIQFIQQVQDSHCRILMIAETAIHCLHITSQLSTKAPIAQVIVIDLDHKSWIDVASALILDTYDVVILDTDIDSNTVQFANVAYALMQHKSSIILSVVDINNILQLQCLPSKGKDVLDQQLFQNILSQNSVLTAQVPIGTHKSSPQAMGYGMKNTSLLLESERGKAVRGGIMDKVYIDQLGDDCAFIVGDYTITKKELIGMIEWWKR